MRTLVSTLITGTLGGGTQSLEIYYFIVILSAVMNILFEGISVVCYTKKYVFKIYLYMYITVLLTLNCACDLELVHIPVPYLIKERL